MKFYKVPKKLLSAQFAKLVAGAVVAGIMGVKERLAWADEQWVRYIKLVDPYERKFVRVLQRMFKQQEREVLTNMKRTGKSLVKSPQQQINSWLFDEKKWKDEFGQAEEDFLVGLATEVGNSTVETLPVVGMMFDVTNPNIKDKMESRVGDF